MVKAKDIDIETFGRQGYLKFEGLLSPSKIAALQAEMDEITSKNIPVAATLPAHAGLVTHPDLMKIADTLMGGSHYGFHHMHSAVHYAGTPAFAWHHDYEQYPQTDRKFTMIHFFMYISGLNGTIGDLLLLPGSHKNIVDRYMYSYLETADLEPETVVINQLPPGSVVAIHSALLHARRPMPGGEGQPRYFIDSSFCQAGSQWPAYRERGNWRETLRGLRERDAARGGKFQFVFNEDYFYE